MQGRLDEALVCYRHGAVSNLIAQKRTTNVRPLTWLVQGDLGED